MIGNYEQEENFKKFLRLLNVSSLDEARRLSTNAVQAANEYQVRTSRNGTWTFGKPQRPYLVQWYCAKRVIVGPQVDGLFIPETPSLLLLHDRFDHSVEVMVGHNGDEGTGYPILTDEQAFTCK
jgi:cholinesterase